MAFRKTFIVSTEKVNTYGFRVLSKGIDLTHATNNCPAFYNHDTRALPLGQWEKFRLNKDGDLLADLVIEGYNEVEKEFIRKIENGDIKGASIGADPLEWDKDPQNFVANQMLPTLTSCDLFEISLTPLPANKSSLRLTREGKPIDISEVIELSDYLNNSVTNKNKFKMTPETLKLLNLDENANATDVHTAVVKLIQGRNEAKTKLTQMQEDRNHAVVEGAISLGKISYAQGEQYKLLLSKDFTETKKLLDSIEAPKTLKKDVTIASLIKKGTGTLEATPLNSLTPGKPKSQWTLNDYRRFAPQDLKRNPELYQELIQKEGKK